jgi:hypothetical protein
MVVYYKIINDYFIFVLQTYLWDIKQNIHDNTNKKY